MFAAKLLAVLPLLATALAQYQSSFIKGLVGAEPTQFFTTKLEANHYDGWFHLEKDLHCTPGTLLGINATDSYKYLYVGVQNNLDFMYLRRSDNNPMDTEIPVTVIANCSPKRALGLRSVRVPALRPLDESAPKEVLALAHEADVKLRGYPSH